LAKNVRRALQGVLQKVGLKSGTAGILKNTVELFPKQDEVDVGKYGNLIALPFARASVALSENDLLPIEKAAFHPYVDSHL
jgi:hypothetical protein